MKQIVRILKILLNDGFVIKIYEKGKVKVKDHDHVSGKYQGSA